MQIIRRCIKTALLIVSKLDGLGEVVKDTQNGLGKACMAARWHD